MPKPPTSPRLPSGTATRVSKIPSSSRWFAVDRDFGEASGELNRLKAKLAISDAVIEKATYIYRKALEKGLVRSRPISTIVASALYAACRDTTTPRTLKDVEQASNIKRKDIARCYRLLIKELDLRMS